VKEGIDSDDHTYYFHYLRTSGNLKISINDLEQYDHNIITHLKKINRNSPIPITLKYFQYFAALFTEIYLDRYFKNPINLLNEIQNFIKEKFANSPSFVYSADDIRKLAFWMATGSGKTHTI
jgi:predicted SAM-dependent methyltransferase